jgi:hypothetical protein
MSNDVVAAASELEQAGDDEGALDKVWSYFDSALNRADFELVNHTLEHLEVDSIGTDVLVALLASSVHAEAKLPARQGFCARVAPLLIARDVNLDDLDGLL